MTKPWNILIRAPWPQVFLYLAGGLLLGAAMVRFLILLGRAPFPVGTDPLLSIRLGYAVALVGLVEFGVALMCLFGKRPNIQVALVGWLSLNYLAYRVGLISMGVHPEWSCIGSLTDPLHFGRGVPGIMTDYVLPSFLLMGSLGAMGFLIVRQRVLLASDFLKISCPACGGHIKFASSNLGQKNDCPHCRKPMTLRRVDENLKMSCFFCQGHIAFPSHALGQKIQCPHCNKDITLKEPS